MAKWSDMGARAKSSQVFRASSSKRGSLRASASQSHSRRGGSPNRQSDEGGIGDFLDAVTQDRGAFMFFVLLAVALVLTGFLFRDSFIQAEKYKDFAESSRTVNLVREARRGTIYDRNGNILAISVDATTVYCVPSEVTNPKETAERIVSVVYPTAMHATNTESSDDMGLQDGTENGSETGEGIDSTLEQAYYDEFGNWVDDGGIYNEDGTYTGTDINSQYTEVSDANGDGYDDITGEWITTDADGDGYDDITGMLISTDGTDPYTVGDEETEEEAKEAEEKAKKKEPTYEERVAEVYRALTAPDTSFSYVVQKIDDDKGEALQNLEIPGLYFLDDTRRDYPYGQVAGQIVGCCNIVQDEETGYEYYTGICGLELYYDEILTGTPGTYIAERGEYGIPIPGTVVENERAVDGQDIVISIDVEMQKALEDDLTEGLKNLGTDSGTAVLMDGANGEIYAAASLPLFDPSDRSVVEEGATQLKCVSNLFEPGSVFKSVSVMCAVEKNVVDPDDEIECPSFIEADGYEISDAEARPDVTYTVEQILNQSSNVGVSLITEKAGFENLYDHIIQYNLHEASGVDYPGEQIGYLPDFESWSRVAGYNIAFGQGVSLTPLQMTRFYGVFVNDGVECTPHFLISKPQTGETMEYKTEDVVENKSALDKMVRMLTTVVDVGTGIDASVPGVEVAGKTSTAEIYDEVNGGYQDGIYNLCFTGFLPGSNSSLVCCVVANDVGGEASVCTIFSRIMTTAVERFNITMLPEDDSNDDSSDELSETNDDSSDSLAEGDAKKGNE